MRGKGKKKKGNKPTSFILQSVAPPSSPPSKKTPASTMDKCNAEDLIAYLEKVIPITHLFAIFQADKSLLWITKEARAKNLDPEDVVVLLDTFTACCKFVQLIEEDTSLGKTKRGLELGDEGRVKPTSLTVLEKLISLSSFDVPLDTDLKGGGDATGEGEQIDNKKGKLRGKKGEAPGQTIIPATMSNHNLKIGNHLFTPYELSRTVLLFEAISKALGVQYSSNEKIGRLYDYIRKHEGDCRQVLVACKLELGFCLESTLHVQLNKKTKWIQLSSRNPGKEILPDVEYLWEIVTASDRAFFLPLGYVFEHADMVRGFYNEKVFDVLLSLEGMEHGDVILYSYTCPRLHPYRIGMRITFEKGDGGKNMEVRWVFKMEKEGSKANDKKIPSQPSTLLLRYVSTTRVLHIPKPANVSSTDKGCPFEVLSCDVKVIPPESLQLDIVDEGGGGKERDLKEEGELKRKVKYKEEACQTSDCDMSKFRKLPESFNFVEEFTDPY